MKPTGRIAATAVLLIALTACGHADVDQDRAESSSALPSAASAPHGDADVTFARDMIPHHEQALVLAAMVPARTANADLRVVATQIGADQTAEIRTLKQLLTDWGEPVETHHHHHDGGMSMPMAMGMVDQPTLDRLTTLSDTAFDTLWIRSMIGHHEGAIDMAKKEVADGSSADAKHVATLIIEAQQREISMMNHLISATQ